VSTSASPEPYNRPDFPTGEMGRAQDPANLDFQPKLHVGMQAPDFAVTTLNGKTMRLSDFRDKQHVVFEFGCITAPVFVNDITSLNRLNARFADQDVQLLVIYAREAHPGTNYPHFTSMDQKLAAARDLQRLEDVQFPVVVDSLEGDAHHLYGLRPSPVYVVDKQGIIAYKASWLVSDELEMVIRHVLEAEGWRKAGRHTRKAYSEIWNQLTLNPDVHERVFARTGGNARAEVARAFGEDIVKAARQGR
jgi:peroxiredoxin